MSGMYQLIERDVVVVKKAPACVVGGEVPWQPLSTAVSETSLSPPAQPGPPAPHPVNHWTKQQVSYLIFIFILITYFIIC